MEQISLRIRDKLIQLRRSEGKDDSLPTLLCIHGNLGSGRWFEPLAERYPGQVIAPDMPNFGESEAIEGWAIGDYARWVGFIAHSLELHNPVVLGHSLGGAVAMELLFQKPQFPRAMVLVDSAPVEGLVTPVEHYPAIEAYKADKNILAQALKSIMPMIQDNELYSALVDDAWKMNRDCFIGHAEALSVADFTDKLRDASLPVAVMHGSMDPLITEDRAQQTAEFFSAKRIKFDTCGHSPMVEIPDEFCQAVISFIKDM